NEGNLAAAGGEFHRSALCEIVAFVIAEIFAKDIVKCEFEDIACHFEDVDAWLCPFFLVRAEERTLNTQFAGKFFLRPSAEFAQVFQVCVCDSHTNYFSTQNTNKFIISKIFMRSSLIGNH